MNSEDLNNLIYKALKLVNEDKYDLAKNMISPLLSNQNNLKPDTYQWQLIGSILLACKDFEGAIASYKNANDPSAVSFILIILGNLSEAEKYVKICPGSPSASWCQFLFDLLLTKKIKKPPTFLQIRNFLEMTVYYFLLAGNYLFVEMLLQNLDKLINSNLDTEKLIGSAYLNFGKLDLAEKFLRSATKRNQLDGETYFMLGRLYCMKNDFLSALDVLQNASLLLKEHMPTEELINAVKEKLSARH